MASQHPDHPAFRGETTDTTHDAQRNQSDATTVGMDKEANTPAILSAQSTFTDRPPVDQPADMPLWSWRVVMMTMIVSTGGLIFGYGGIGQIGGFLAMQDYRDRFGNMTKDDGKTHLSETRQGTIVALLMIGALIGSLVAGKIADKIGRKKSITLWSLIYMAGQVVEITATTTWYQVVIGRTIEGLGIGGLSILVPMYQGETAPKETRGVIVSMYQLFITLGILLASLINLGTKNLAGSASWRTTIGIGILWPLMLAIGIQFLDESPRWDMANDKVDRATRTVAKMCNTDPSNEYVRHEVAEMRHSIQKEMAQAKPNLLQIHKEPTILRRFVVGMVLQAMQQMTGINYFFYFGVVLFATLDVGDSYITAVVLGAVNFVATFGGLYIAKRFGHRNALILGGYWIGFWLLLYAFFGHFCIEKSCGLDPKPVGSAMVLFTCVAIVGFATTWGPLAWVVCAEIFPSRWRGVGMGAATATNWTFNFLIAFFTTTITNKIGYALGFVFAGTIICGACFVVFAVHETAGKSLEAIDQEILDGVKPWNTKKGK